MKTSFVCVHLIVGSYSVVYMGNYMYFQKRVILEGASIRIEGLFFFYHVLSVDMLGVSETKLIGLVQNLLQFKRSHVEDLLGIFEAKCCSFAAEYM